jgi:hypothetical protein
VKLEKLRVWSKMEGVGIILAPDSKFISQDEPVKQNEVYELKSA